MVLMQVIFYIFILTSLTFFCETSSKSDSINSLSKLITNCLFNLMNATYDHSHNLHPLQLLYIQYAIQRCMALYTTYTRLNKVSCSFLFTKILRVKKEQRQCFPPLEIDQFKISVCPVLWFVTKHTN